MSQNQHFVDRLYLKRFAYETGKNPHLHAFDKSTRRSIRPSVKSIACELNFYGPADTAVEQMLGRLETQFAPAYQRLREAETVNDITNLDRAVIAAFVAFQMIRTQEFREHLKSMTSELDRWAKRYGHNLDPSYTTITEEDCRQIQLSSMLTMVPQLAETMLHMKWIRLSNETKLPFWTSDHPINRYNPRPSELTGNTGLKCRGIQVFFPLSPGQALCLCDPIDYRDFPNDARVEDPQNVVFQNNLQVRESTRFVFSQQSDFELAHKILKDYPEFGDPRRLRVQAAGLDAP